MTMFYLHLFNRIGNVRDEEGRDLLDLAAAEAEALRSARSIMADESCVNGQIDLNARIDSVSPTADDIFGTLAFTDTVVIRPPETL
jgi:hypothetical protein